MNSLFKKILIILGALVAAVVLFLAALWLPFFNKVKPMEFGVSFSKPYAESLGLDWQAVYAATLDDLGTKYLRLGSEWDKIETSDGSYDFSALDWQIAEAEARGVKVILVLGNRQPRWPECHTPDWLSDALDLEIKERTIEFIKVVVERYKDSPAVEMWQVENEPLFNIFGNCPRSDIYFLKREIEFVKSLDSRPVMITDSGELSTWSRTAHLGDFFGTSVYRLVYNRYIGYFQYFWAPSSYRLKAKLVGLSLDKAIISELQAEPWFGEGFEFASPADQKKIMPPEKMAKQIDFARQTGFPRAYVWGVEWWYWLKEQGDDSLWQEGKKIWQP